ncbi:hypothetical protein, partial [uncultured Parasutterella sp.]
PKVTGSNPVSATNTVGSESSGPTFSIPEFIFAQKPSLQFIVLNVRTSEFLYSQTKQMPFGAFYLDLVFSMPADAAH